MRAMLLEKPAKIESKPLKLVDLDMPTISKDELLIRIKTCGVCRSNLHLIEGDWLKYGIPPKLPIIPGHEIVGIVEEIGEDVRYFKKGDRVGIQPLYESCLNCDYCLTGNEHLCDNRRITGDTENGGYAEYISIREQFAYKIPDSINDVEAAPLFCPGVTAYRAVKLAELNPNERVGIFGIGGVGHIALQIAKLYNARVVAVTRSKLHQEVAEKLSADEIYSNNDDLGLLDKAIIFAPSDEAISKAIRSVKKKGTIILGVFGCIGDDFMFIDEKIIKGSVIGSRKDMRDVLTLASRGLIKIITKEFPLEDANEVLEALKYSKIEARAVLKV
ncbi:MAG: zinc-dependent alcohol dehydrogenase [Candidatus Nitrosocaldaceae archaeon]|nr:MAG: zinc-dependent alcohol dehydrogenase [Candidatus Nitrosocaldaceae archaeon]